MRKCIAWILFCVFVALLLGACDGSKDGSLAYVPTYSISGTITANSSGLEGVTVTLSTASTITTATTDNAGNYSFAGLTNGTYTLMPSKSGFSFTPTTRPAAVHGGDLSGQDFAGSTKSYIFEKLAGPTIWTSLKRTITVDNLDQVYVTSGSTIFRVNAGGPIMYLSAADIAAAIGGGANASSLDIPSIDVGPDGKLYILETRYRKILVSDGLGSVAVHRDLSNISGFPRSIGIMDSDNILLMNLYDGLWFVKGSGNTLLYDDTLVLGGTNCGTEDFAARFDGHFAYLPGCNGSPMVGGPSDGSGVGILMTNSADVGLGGAWYNFSAIGRNSTGGYIVNIDGKRIAHVTITGQYELIHTQPELDALATAMGEGPFGFQYGVIAEGPTGNIFVASSTAVYVAR